MKQDPIEVVKAKLAAVRAKRAEIVAKQAAEIAPYDAAVKKLETMILSHYLDTDRVPDVVEWYIAVRDAKDAEAERQKAVNAGFAFVMGRIEKWFLKRFERTGAKSENYPTGSVAKKTRRSVKVEDADEFFTWVVQEEHPEMLEKRASKTAVETWLEGTQEDGTPNPLPPGLSLRAEVVVSITRPRKS